MIIVLGMVPMLCGFATVRSAGDDVALKIETDIDGVPVLLRRAAPDALVILFESQNVRVAAGLDARLRLPLRKAVSPCNRRVRVVRIRRVHGIVAGTALRRWLLCKSRTNEQSKSCGNYQQLSH